MPVVRLESTTFRAGGAANVAANITGLGATPLLVGVVGDDNQAKFMPDVLRESNVSEEYLIKIAERPTTVKTRIIAHSQQIVRLDQETSAALAPEHEKTILEQIERLLDQVQIVVVSDYAKGVITDAVSTGVIAMAAERNISVLVDPKGKNYDKYKGSTLLTPNRMEAADACKLEENGQSLVETAGTRLMSDIETDAIIITQGEDGLTLFEKGKAPLHLIAKSRDVYDVTGAGDTFIATLAVALGSGAGLSEAADLANQAAGVVVEQIGTTSITLSELRKALERNNSSAV